MAFDYSAILLYNVTILLLRIADGAFIRVLQESSCK